MNVTLGGNLPAHTNNNGLPDWSDRLVDEAADMTLVCVVAIRTNKIVEKVSDNERYPVLQIAWVEPIARLGQVPPELQKLVVEARAQRIGEPLPFDPIPPQESTYSTGPDDSPARADKAARDARKARGKTVQAVPSDDEHDVAAVFTLPTFSDKLNGGAS